MLTHAGLFELFAVTRVFLPVTSWRPREGFFLTCFQPFTFFFFFYEAVFWRARRRGVAAGGRPFFESPDFYIRVAISFLSRVHRRTRRAVSLGRWAECCSTVERLYWKLKPPQIVLPSCLPKMLHAVFVRVRCSAANTFFKGGSEKGVDVILP